MQLCQKHNLHLLCDEIYALSVWKNPEAPDAPEFTSALSIDTEGLIDRNRVHAMWGMSKVCIKARQRQYENSDVAFRTSVRTASGSVV